MSLLVHVAENLGLKAKRIRNMSLTCISCKLLFSVPELHHEHYKSDWHRYNLKRRIINLPPLSKAEFEERAAAFQATSKEKEKISLGCNVCNKRFSSKNAMVNHLKSKKHQEEAALAKTEKPNSKTYSGDVKNLQEDRVRKLQEDGGGKIQKNDAKKLQEEPKEKEIANSLAKNSDVAAVEVEEDDDEEWEDDDGEWESCDDEDEEGEVRRVVVDTNDCLFCNHQSDSTEENVAHMTEGHSFFIPDIEYLSNLDGLIAFLAGKIHLGYFCLWCDSTGKQFKSVQSVRRHMVDKGHCKMLYEGEVMVEYADFYDYSSCDVKEDSLDESAIATLLENADYELVLPSGATVGHRSLAMYYNQNLKPVDSNSRRKVKRILEHYKSLGYTGATGEAAVKKARDIMFVQRMKSRYNLKLGMKQNKFQPHYRPQIRF